VDECKKAGLPEPEFREQFGGLSVHFRKADKAREAQVEAQLKAQSGASRRPSQKEYFLFCHAQRHRQVNCCQNLDSNLKQDI
jgi:ATP-dependent DNA helicase RecG